MNPDELYRQFKLVKDLQQTATNNYVNDFSDVDGFENTYCDLCDRKLKQYDTDRLFCPDCQIIIDTKFTLVKHKPARIGPVDGDIESGNDISNISEYYHFQTRPEEKDTFVDSLKGKGYQIISSNKQ
jgi:hypothetical protein